MYVHNLSLLLLPVLIQSFSTTTFVVKSRASTALASSLKPPSSSSSSAPTGEQKKQDTPIDEYSDELDLEKLVYEWEQLEDELDHLKEQEQEVSKHLPLKSRHDMLETLEPQEAYLAEAMLQTALDTVRVKLHLESQRTVEVFEKLQEAIAAQRVGEVHLKVAIDEAEQAQNHLALMMESSNCDSPEQQLYSFTCARAACQVEQKMRDVVDQLKQETIEAHEEYNNLYDMLDGYTKNEEELVTAFEALQVFKAEMVREGKIHNKYTHDNYLYKFLPL